MGRRVADNFKKRFGDPERIEIKFETGNLSPSEEARRNEKMATAYVEVLRGILGREPTQDEIIDKVDIPRSKRQMGMFENRR